MFDRGDGFEYDEMDGEVSSGNQTNGLYQDDREFCVCKQHGDPSRVLVKCTKCHELFHPACLGKDLNDFHDDRSSGNTESKAGTRGRVDTSFTGRDCDQCNEHIYGIRYRCKQCPELDYCSECWLNSDIKHDDTHGFDVINEFTGRGCEGCDSDIFGVRHTCLTCLEFDYCSDCFEAMEGKHDPRHVFEAIHGNDFGSHEKVGGIPEKPAKKSFTCLDCDQKMVNETLAAQMMGGKHRPLAEIHKSHVKSREVMRENMKKSQTEVRCQKRVELSKARDDDSLALIIADYVQLGIEDMGLDRVRVRNSRISKSSSRTRSKSRAPPQKRRRRSSFAKKMADLFGEDDGEALETIQEEREEIDVERKAEDQQS